MNEVCTQYPRHGACFIYRNDFSINRLFFLYFVFLDSLCTDGLDTLKARLIYSEVVILTDRANYCSSTA